jgi:predicted transcriptional regulator
LTEIQTNILSALCGDSMSLSEVALCVGKPHGPTAESLQCLERRGLVKWKPGGYLRTISGAEALAEALEP